MALSLPLGWLYACLAGMCWRKSGLRGRRSAVGSLPIKRLVNCDDLFLIYWLCFEELVREKMNCRWLWLLGCSTLTLLNSRRLGLRRFCSSETCSYLVSSVWTYLVDEVSYAGLLCLHSHGLLWRWRHVSVIQWFRGHPFSCKRTTLCYVSHWSCFSGMSWWRNQMVPTFLRRYEKTCLFCLSDWRKEIIHIALITPNNPQVLLKWFAQLVLAVDYLHSNYVLHRDLKVSGNE